MFLYPLCITLCYSMRNADAYIDTRFLQANTNIALDKPTEQSSIGWGGLASRAVDGKTSGIWGHGSITHTNKSTNPWWKVDLEGQYNIEYINIFNRIDCCSDRLKDFVVEITKDGSTV